MNGNLRTDELLRSYLLGELPEEEMDRLEQELLEDDELFDLCEAQEADLLAAYDRGELTTSDKERVQRCLISSPGGRKRLALAHSLNTLADQSSKTQPAQAAVVPLRQRGTPTPQFEVHWALAAAVLLAVIGLWLAIEGHQDKSGAPTQMVTDTSTPAPQPRPVVPPRSTDQITKAPAPQEPQPPPNLAQSDERTPPQPPAQPQHLSAVITLSLATLRGAEGVEKFLIPAGVELIEIQVDLEGLEDYRSFDAAVKSGTKGTVWEKKGLTPKRLDWGTALVLEVPARHLTPGRYEVAVTAGAETLTQDFEVVGENQ